METGRSFREKMDELTDREKELLEALEVFPDATLDELGILLNISRERVRQLSNRIIEKGYPITRKEEHQRSVRSRQHERITEKQKEREQRWGEHRQHVRRGRVLRRRHLTRMARPHQYDMTQREHDLKLCTFSGCHHLTYARG